MSWIESHQALEKHPKTLDLAQRMGWTLDETIGKLHRFWWWCLDYAPDGDLRKHSVAVLAGSVGIPPASAEEFLINMLESRWIDKKPYRRIHDWWEYVGRFLQIRYKHNPLKGQEIRDAYKNGSNNGSRLPSKNRSKNYIPTNLNPPTYQDQPDQPTPLVSNADAIRLSELLRDLIRGRKTDFKDPPLTSWVRDMDLLIRIDQRKVGEIEAVIHWCQQDPFWQNNILSVGKLRKQYDQLDLRRRANPLTNGRTVQLDAGIQAFLQRGVTS